MWWGLPLPERFCTVALRCSSQGIQYVIISMSALCREEIGANAAHYPLPLFAAWTGIQVG